MCENVVVVNLDLPSWCGFGLVDREDLLNVRRGGLFIGEGLMYHGKKGARGGSPVGLVSGVDASSVDSGVSSAWNFTC